MKKVVIPCVLLSLAVFILLPICSNGKCGASKTVVADGSPLPWPPIPTSNAILVADGFPLLPPIPPSAAAGTLVADGFPLPPPIPPSGAVDTLVADGFPLPPPIPPAASAASYAA